jgi:DNA-binding response OmpR family regulator
MPILLVEDEVSLASFIQKGVAAEGYDIKVAYDGSMGQRLLAQQPYDVVVLDVNLPGMNGPELYGPGWLAGQGKRLQRRGRRLLGRAI